MKVKLIATATNKNHPGFLQFERSLKKFNWPYEILSDRYIAYGSKAKNAYEYAKKTDCTYLFITDAYDIFMQGSMETALDSIKDKNCILFNAEKGCWPNGELASQYPQVESRWKYLNGGACFVSVPLFIKLFEENPIKDTDNDQANFTDIYLNKGDLYNMKLDTNCEVFQSIAFEDPDDFKIWNLMSDHSGDGVLVNSQTNTYPLILHGNGGTSMDKIYKLF